VLSNNVATTGKYLQTWKLKLNTTKTVLAVFQLNNKQVKREVEVNFNNEILTFSSEDEYLGVTWTRRSRIADTSSYFTKS